MLTGSDSLPQAPINQVVFSLRSSLHVRQVSLFAFDKLQRPVNDSLGVDVRASFGTVMLAPVFFKPLPK